MSQEFLPILYFNMSGEMFYIIDQRLAAQNIEESKHQQVLEDIGRAIFNPKLIDEIFKPHTMITFPILRSIFEKLAHSSIMRLNEQSMNKLFDLMVMVVKYQIYSCPKPSDLLVITDNHFVSMMQMVTWNSDLLQNIENIRAQFLHHFNTNFNLQTLQAVRYTLLNFFKDIHTRVSIFLRKGLQSSDGRFLNKSDKIRVDCECQIPGAIRYFRPEDGEIIRTEKFETGAEFCVDDRQTTLGLNIYRSDSDDSQEDAENDSGEAKEDSEQTQHTKEMDLLAMLICRKDPENDLELKFDFLEPNSSSKESENGSRRDSRRTSKVVEIVSDLSKRKSHLSEILDDFQPSETSNNGQRNDKESSAGNDENDDELDYLELIDS